MGGRTSSNWTEEEYLALISVWQEEEENILTLGEKESDKKERIYNKFINTTQFDKRTKRAVDEKLNGLENWFRAIARYNKFRNPDNLPELDWFLLSKEKKEETVKGKDLPYVKLRKPIYEKLAEFLGNKNLPQYGGLVGTPIKLQKPDNNLSKQTLNLDNNLNNLTNTQQFNDVLANLSSLMEYNDTSNNPTKKVKCLSESFNQENIPAYEEIFKELLKVQQIETAKFCGMFFEKYSNLICNDIAKYNDSLYTKLFDKFKDLVKESAKENTLNSREGPKQDASSSQINTGLGRPENNTIQSNVELERPKNNTNQTNAELGKPGNSFNFDF